MPTASDYSQASFYHVQRMLFEEMLPSWSGLDDLQQMRRIGRIMQWQDCSTAHGSVGLLEASCQTQAWVDEPLSELELVQLNIE